MDQQTSCPLCGDAPLDLVAYEKACVLRALREAAGDPLSAIAPLKVSRSTFYRLIRRHKIERKTLVRNVSPF